MSKKIDNKKSIVIVGAGTAGVNLARPLSAKLDATKYSLTVIDPRPFRVLLPATLRMVVSAQDDLATTDGALVPHDKLFHNGDGTFIQDSVQKVTQAPGENVGTLTLGSGEVLEYDVLVLATGLAWAHPLAFPDTVEELQAYVEARRAEFAAADSYLLVGGGAIGCELAGELKDIWPTKDVTIVHSSPLLLNDTYNTRYRKRVARDLVRRGVQLHLNELASPESISKTGITTQSGLQLSAGLVVKTTGAAGPNTAFLHSLGADLLTPAGFVKVTPTLQLPGFPNIFAAGDIVEWAEQKQSIKAQKHAAVVLQNVLALVNGSSRRRRKEYRTGFEMIVLTNGKRAGSMFVGVLWGIILGGWITALVKSKELLVSRFRHESGLR
ncbi:Apoptosis-inducing factor [Mycena chlorophos]|uniref:Apoptosis-inducing factor n=1 Tax=Mycena chlorophos TaxID=658473 RepID=A0A8H6SKL6_MYCCL|nr:Apoptosis-inducing factor [Mycena chlorophos]